MNVLILGGTGVIGNSLVKKYNEAGINVYVTSRREHKDFGSIHYIKGNAMDDSFLQRICSERLWDAIVDFMSYKTEFFSRRVNVFLKSTKQYVFISSARVYGNNEHPIKETSPRLLDSSQDPVFLATDEYSLTKARQENFLINSEAKNYTIVRPCITYGPERLQLGVLEKEEWLYRVLHGRNVIFCQDFFNAITTMTIGDDMCALLYKIIGNRAAIGECYHLTSAHHRTWQEILSIYRMAIKRVCGIEFKIKIVPMDKFLKCRSQSLKYQTIYDRIYDRDYDTSKERLLADIDSFTTPEDGLSKCIETFITEKRHFKAINWVYEARKDRLSGEKTPLSEIKGLNNKVHYILERYIKRI